MARIDHAGIAERASKRLGLVTTQDLASLRVTRRQVDGMVAAGWLRRVGSGVLAVAAALAGPHQRLLAATLRAGDGAVASHHAAAWLWGFDGITPTSIEVSVPAHRRPRLDGVIVHRVGDLLPVDLTVRGPQPVTTPARTILDLAGVVSPERLEDALDGARRRGQVHLPFLEWHLAEVRRRGRRGVRGVDALLAVERTSARAESWLESAFLRILRDAWLPPPRVQVVKRAGGRRMRLDACYDDQQLVVEVSVGMRPTRLVGTVRTMPSGGRAWWPWAFGSWTSPTRTSANGRCTSPPPSEACSASTPCSTASAREATSSSAWRRSFSGPSSSVGGADPSTEAAARDVSGR